MTDHLDQHQIHALLDGEVEPVVRQALQTHLADCARCRAELEAAQELFQAIGGLPDQQLGIDLVPGVLAAIQPAPRWLQSLALGELLAALAVGIGLMLSLGSETVSLRVTEAAQAIGPAIDDLVQSLMAAAANALPDPAGYRLELGLPAIWTIVLGTIVFWLLSNGLVLRRVSRSNRA